MKLYRTPRAIVVEESGTWRELPASADWDELVNRPNLSAHLREQIRGANTVAQPAELLAPIGSQEVWAAGVTYLRSRDARMDEAHQAGGGSFYDRVYGADRPELFFKSMPHRVIGPGAAVRLRKDSKWQVPEPELTLLINRAGKIAGYTIGNDMSCRDIEGENPLYLPQAKMYEGSCAIGPCVLVAEEEPLPRSTRIELTIRRVGREVFSGSTSLERMKRRLDELAGWLCRELTFENGAHLLTGTGIVPPDNFTLVSADEIRIGIEGIGELVNPVA